jgi:hypothetical protein
MVWLSDGGRGRAGGKAWCDDGGRGATDAWLEVGLGWLYGLSRLSMNSRLMAGPLLMGGKNDGFDGGSTCASALDGNNEACIISFGVVLPVFPIRGSSTDWGLTVGAGCWSGGGGGGAAEGMRSTGCSNDLMLGNRIPLFRLLVLNALTLSSSSLARVLLATALPLLCGLESCDTSLDTELVVLSCLLATRGMGGKIGGIKLKPPPPPNMLFLFSRAEELTDTPSLVCGLARLSALARNGSVIVLDSGGSSSKSNVICSGLTSGGGTAGGAAFVATFDFTTFPPLAASSGASFGLFAAVGSAAALGVDPERSLRLRFLANILLP